MVLQRSTATYLHALVTSASKRCNLATHIFTFLQHLHALVQLLPHHKGLPNTCNIFSSDIYSIDFHKKNPKHQQNFHSNKFQMCTVSLKFHIYYNCTYKNGLTCFGDIIWLITNPRKKYIYLTYLLSIHSTSLSMHPQYHPFASFFLCPFWQGGHPASQRTVLLNTNNQVHHSAWSLYLKSQLIAAKKN
jgi:hypothetical protein